MGFFVIYIGNITVRYCTAPESRQKHLAKRLRICGRYARVEISALVRHVLAVKTQNLKISCENLTILVKILQKLR